MWLWWTSLLIGKNGVLAVKLPWMSSGDTTSKATSGSSAPRNGDRHKHYFVIFMFVCLKEDTKSDQFIWRWFVTVSMSQSHNIFTGWKNLVGSWKPEFTPPTPHGHQSESMQCVARCLPRFLKTDSATSPTTLEPVGWPVARPRYLGIWGLRMVFGTLPCAAFEHVGALEVDNFTLQWPSAKALILLKETSTSLGLTFVSFVQDVTGWMELWTEAYLYHQASHGFPYFHSFSALIYLNPKRSMLGWTLHGQAAKPPTGNFIHPGSRWSQDCARFGHGAAVIRMVDEQNSAGLPRAQSRLDSKYATMP